MRDTVHQPVTLSGAGASDPIDLSGRKLAGIHCPAGTDSTAITFTAATEVDGTYVAVHDSSGAVSVTVAASQHTVIDPDLLQGVRWLRVVPGTAQDPALDITLVLVEDL